MDLWVGLRLVGIDGMLMLQIRCTTFCCPLLLLSSVEQTKEPLHLIQARRLPVGRMMIVAVFLELSLLCSCHLV